MGGKNWNLYAINGMYYVVTALFSPYISAYYQYSGLDKRQIGILSAVFPLTSLLIQPLWAYLSDRTGKRKQILQLLCFCCAVAVLLFRKAEGFREFLAAAFCFAAFYTALLPLGDALVIGVADRKKIDFSRIRLTGTICYAFATLGMGRILKNNFPVMFLVNSVCFLLYSAFCATVRIPGPDCSDGAGGGSRIGRGAKAGPGRPGSAPGGRGGRRQMVLVLVCAFAMQMGLTFNLSFLSVHLLELGYDQGTIGLVSCLSAFSELPVLLAVKWICRRWPLLYRLSAVNVLCGIRLLLASGSHVALIALSQLLQGPTYIICYFTCVNYIKERSGEEKISEGQSMLSWVQNGLGSICGSFLGGIIAQRAGVQSGYRVMACGIILIALFAAIANRKEEGYNEV